MCLWQRFEALTRGGRSEISPIPKDQLSDKQRMILSQQMFGNFVFQRKTEVIDLLMISKSIAD